MKDDVNVTWEQLWVTFKKETGSEDTYLFYKWVFENGFKPVK